MSRWASEDQVENQNIRWQPLEVYTNFDFSEVGGKFPYPFATKEEVSGLLSGSEHWTLCSKGDPIYSRSFVQCGAALARNRSNGLITLIHESTWSESADAALALQRSENLDVITISGPFGYMRFNDVKYAHEKNPKDAIDSIDRVDIDRSRKYGEYYGGENRAHLFRNSAIPGLTEDAVNEMLVELSQSNKQGNTRHVGEIDLPVIKAESNRWYLLYRPSENVIWIYDSGAKKLFKYPGFQ